MGKTLKTVGAIVGGAVLIATGVGALAGLNVAAMGISSFTGSLTIGQLGALSAGVSAVGGMLDKPKSSGAAPATDWTANEDQPTPFAFGRVGVAGKIVHWDEYGKDNKLKSFVSVYSGAGPIKGFVSFKAGDLPVSFATNGGTAIGKYNRQMWRSWKVGDQPDTALPLPVGLDDGAVMPQWGAAYKLSGKACDLWTLQQDSKLSVYPGNAEPKPIAVLEGVFGYDHRYDSSYPGGFGPCRLNDRSTWRWIEDPIIGALNWALGMKENGQVVGGVGASISGIDLPAFAEAANISEANGWKVSAWPDTAEDASVVLDQLLQAGGAVRARHAGKISCVSRGAARPSIVTITRRDTAGAIELDTGASLFNRLNTITPVFMSEAHGWKHTPADPVTFEAFRIEDGGKRGDKIDYRFVPEVQQAAQLAAYDILDAREPFSGTIPLKPHMRRLKRGDCFDIDEPGFLMDGVKCLVLSRSYDPSKGEVRIAFRSETDGKHDLALGKTAALPEYPTLTPADPTLVSPPLPDDWTIVVRPPAPGGTQLPGFDLSGIVSNSTATAIIVEHGPTAEGPWTTAYQGPPTVTTIPIDGLQSGETYFIAVQYQRNQNYSERAVYGPCTAPGLVADDSVAGRRTQEVVNDLNAQLREVIEQLLGLANDRAAGQLGAALARLTAVQDALARLMLLAEIDPVAGTAVVRGDVMLEGEEETLAQTFVVVRAATAAASAAVALEQLARVAGDEAEASARLLGLAQAASALAAADLSIRAWTDGQIASATAGLATTAAVAASIAASALSLQSWTNGQIAAAVVGLATTASVAAAIADSALSLQSWTNGQIATATAGLATTAAVASAIAASALTLRSDVTAEIATATAGLATAAQLSTAIAAALIQSQLQVDAYAASANLTFAGLASFNGLASTVGIHGSAIAGIEAINNVARLELIAAAGGGVPARIGITSAAGSSAIALDASELWWGANTVFDAATGQLRTTYGSGSRRVIALGASFGAEGLWMWTGPATTLFGSETFANATGAAESDTRKLWGGETLSSPFEAASGAGVISLGSGWTTVASTTAHQMLPGRITMWAQWSAILSPSGSTEAPIYGVVWMLSDTDISGGDERLVSSGYETGPANFAINMGVVRAAGLVTSSGLRVLRLRMMLNPDDDTVAASVNTVKLAGDYLAGAGLASF